MIDRFYTTSIAVTRMVWTGNSAEETAGVTFSGHIQQASPEFVEKIGQAWGKVFTIWCAKDTNVAEGDKLTIATGDYAGTYNVQNKQTNATGANEHVELTVIKDV